MAIHAKVAIAVHQTTPTNKSPSHCHFNIVTSTWHHGRADERKIQRKHFTHFVLYAPKMLVHWLRNSAHKFPSLAILTQGTASIGHNKVSGIGNIFRAMPFLPNIASILSEKLISIFSCENLN